MQSGESGFRNGLGIESDLGGDLGGAHGDARFFGLHLAIGGRLGIARCHAGCGLRGAAGADAGLLRAFLGGRLGSAALMGGEAPIDFFFPLGSKFRLCAQSSRSPFGAALFTGSPRRSCRWGWCGPLFWSAGQRCEPQTLLSMEVGGRGLMAGGARIPEAYGREKAGLSCRQSCEPRIVRAQKPMFAMLGLGPDASSHFCVYHDDDAVSLAASRAGVDQCVTPAAE